MIATPVATTVCVDDEPIQGAARVPVRADVRPLKPFYPPRPDKDSSSQLIRSLLLSTSLVMAYDPEDEAIASLNTITSATPQSLPKVVESTGKHDDGETPHGWRGVHFTDIPRKVMVTKRIEHSALQNSSSGFRKEYRRPTGPERSE